MIETFIEARSEIIKKVFNNNDSDLIHMPIAFTHLINNIQGQQSININSLVDITPLETLEFASNVININSKFFNEVVGSKKTALNGIKIRWISGDLNDKLLTTVREIRKVTGWSLLESKNYFDNNIKNEK